MKGMRCGVQALLYTWAAGTSHGIVNQANRLTYCVLTHRVFPFLEYRIGQRPLPR
jgi:hypothetical protein